MTRIEVIRYLVLILPLVALVAAMQGGSRTRRERGALLLAGIASFVGLGVLHELARLVGWWDFLDVAGSWRGFPVDLWIGWAVLWGPLPVALRRHVGLPVAVLAAAWLDVVMMPWLHPLVVLEAGWMWGEAAGLAGVLVPSVLLGRWCADRRRLEARASLQVLVFGGLILWLLPTTAMTFGDGSWEYLAELSSLQIVLLVQVVLVVALPGVAAVVDLATRGNGTPFPWDPPDRLVVSGPYAYVANPMQLSATVLLIILAGLTRSWSILAAAVGAATFSATVAEPHEREALRGRFGVDFDDYRREVRTWLPRRRPYLAGDAILYLAEDCPLCQQLATTVTAAEVPRLAVGGARAHPSSPERALYRSADGCTDLGVAAVGRTLEHLNLGAAMLGWFVRMPLVSPLLQLVTDTVVPPATPIKEQPR